MSSRRDMRGLAERFIRRHGQRIEVLDADRLARSMQRFVPIEMRDAKTLSRLRCIVIDVAGQRFVPTRWGRLSAAAGRHGGRRVGSR